MNGRIGTEGDDAVLKTIDAVIRLSLFGLGLVVWALGSFGIAL
jgi:hypothetical protein